MIPYEQSVRPEPVEGQVLDVSPFLKGIQGDYVGAQNFVPKNVVAGLKPALKAVCNGGKPNALISLPGLTAVCHCFENSLIRIRHP